MDTTKQQHDLQHNMGKEQQETSPNQNSMALYVYYLQERENFAKKQKKVKYLDTRWKN